MKTNFNKIVLVSLCDKFSKKVGEILSQSLGMMFCDTKDLVEYELIDKNALKKISTKEYLDEAEKKVLAHIASFENVVVSISFDYLANNLDILNNGSLIVFLRLPRVFVEKHGGNVNAIAYQSRSAKLEEIARVSLNIQEEDEMSVCEKIIEALGGIL